MKSLRSYIAQLLVALLICSGLSLSWVQPVQADHTSHAFARWLSMRVQSSKDASELQKQLQELKASGGQLDDLLKKASQIVTNNDEEFNFPFSEHGSSQELSQLLLIEWNQYQTGNAMADIPVRQNIKPLLPIHVDKIKDFFFDGWHFPNPHWLLFDEMPDDTRPVNITAAAVSPMSGGIAIGAP